MRRYTMYNQRSHCPPWIQWEKYVEGRKIFIDDFIEYNGYAYTTVFDRRVIHIVNVNGDDIRYEVSTNYRDNDFIVVEEYADILNKEKELGWWYTSQSDVHVFLSEKTRVMVMLPITPTVKKIYEEIKSKCRVRYNSMWHKGGILKKASYRIIPLTKFNGLYTVYKKSKVIS